MAFSINSHQGREEKYQQLEISRKKKKKKEKRKSGAKALQSCDRGSLPSSFLLLVLSSTQ